MNPIINPNGVNVWGAKTLSMVGEPEGKDYTEECNKCNGTGKVIDNIPSEQHGCIDLKEIHCRFCAGNGKVNWLDKMYNRPRKRGLSAKWNIDPSQDMTVFHNIQQDIVDKMAEQMALKIDEDIMKTFINGEWEDK